MDGRDVFGYARLPNQHQISNANHQTGGRLGAVALCRARLNGLLCDVVRLCDGGVDGYVGVGRPYRRLGVWALNLLLPDYRCGTHYQDVGVGLRTRNGWLNTLHSASQYVARRSVGSPLCVVGDWRKPPTDNLLLPLRGVGSLYLGGGIRRQGEAIYRFRQAHRRIGWRSTLGCGSKLRPTLLHDATHLRHHPWR